MSEKTASPPVQQQPKQQTPAQQPFQWPKDGPAFLLSKNWTPEGDPYHPDTLWMDPTKPRETTEERVKIGTRKLPNNRMEDVVQTHVTPACMGVRQGEAVAEQLRRDRLTAEKKG